tara:strand:+ start:88 stop:861 length:774 start_codon:yes stop_codon:yes gene_type:complete
VNKSLKYIKFQRNKKKPVFTIITVTRNSEKHVEECVKSVLRQKFKNFEYIIIDGKSSDKTVKILKKYQKKINIIISEKDRGIYDAFNKGVNLSEGKFICIVNSDDVLTPNALLIINKYINKKNFDFIFGSVKKHWGILHGYRPNKIKYSWGFYSSHSTGFFISKNAAHKVGKYNIKYNYHADYDYFYRMIVKKKLIGTSTKKNEITGIFRRGGYSSTIPFKKLFFEEIKIRYDNGQNVLLLLIIIIYKIITNYKKFF